MFNLSDMATASPVQTLDRNWKASGQRVAKSRGQWQERGWERGIDRSGATDRDAVGLRARQGGADDPGSFAWNKPLPMNRLKSSSPRAFMPHISYPLPNPVGGTGDPPVPAGDSPTGTRDAILPSDAVFYRRVVRCLPPGQLPGGTGADC